MAALRFASFSFLVTVSLFAGDPAFATSPEESNVAFYAGQKDDISGSPLVSQIAGTPGDVVDLWLFYTEPVEAIHGFQIAGSYDCNLNFVEDAFPLGEDSSTPFSVEGTILEAVGAEFVIGQVDNDPNDGDGCDFTVGILLDLLPPYDFQTVPPTLEPLKIGRFRVAIGEEAPSCSSSGCLDVNFQNGMDGTGGPALDNTVIFNLTESIAVNEFHGAGICVFGGIGSTVGDANGDGSLNIADPIYILQFVFQGGPPPVPFGAGDINADGAIDLADANHLLHYLFLGGPPPVESCIEEGDPQPATTSEPEESPPAIQQPAETLNTETAQSASRAPAVAQQVSGRLRGR